LHQRHGNDEFRVRPGCGVGESRELVAAEFDRTCEVEYAVAREPECEADQGPNGVINVQGREVLVDGRDDGLTGPGRLDAPMPVGRAPSRR
jgi:hypothetical protein